MIPALLALALAALPVDPLLPGSPGVLRGHTDTITAVAFSRDGTRLASAARDKTVRVWNAQTGEALFELKGAESQVVGLDWSADGTRLAVADVSLQLRLVEVPSGKVLKTIAHTNPLMDVALSPDGALLAVGAVGDNGGVYTTADGKQLRELRARSVRFSADGKGLLVGRSTGEVEWWDTKKWKVVRQASAEGSPNALVLGDGARWLAWTGGSPSVQLVDPRKPKKPVVLTPQLRTPGDLQPRAVVNSAGVSADGAVLATSHADFVLRLWDVKRGAVTRVIELQKQGVVAVRPDGQQVAVGDGAVVKVWPVAAPAADGGAK